MGLELAELCLLQALAARSHDRQTKVNIRVVGGRSARRHARRLGVGWVPGRRNASSRLAFRAADMVHLLGLDVPPPPRKRFVAMVHDLSPLHYDDEGVLPDWLDEVVGRASLLFTPSQFTATELSRDLAVPPERIRVIGSGPALEAFRAEPLSADELRRLGIEPPFVLRYGGYTKRKNVPLLLDAWSHVPCGTLVLTGPAQEARSRILAAAPSLERVAILDYVSRDLLARLLRSATALVSTSSYEGFGLPPLEAMAAGTPVVAVAEPFAREVCGEAALLTRGEARDISAGLHRVMTDAAYSSRLRTAGIQRAKIFTWKDVVHKMLSGWADAARGP